MSLATFRVAFIQNTQLILKHTVGSQFKTHLQRVALGSGWALLQKNRHGNTVHRCELIVFGRDLSRFPETPETSRTMDSGADTFRD